MSSGGCEKTCNELETLFKAPRALILFIGITVFVVWAMMEMRFGVIVRSQQEQIILLKEKLNRTPSHNGEYSRLTPEELQTVVYQFIDDFRKFLADTNLQMVRQFYADQAELKAAKDQATRQKIWEKQNTRAAQESLDLKKKYDESFKEKARILRNELLLRLPHGSGRQPGPHGDLYTSASNSLEMQDVADDLERLAQLLKY